MFGKTVLGIDGEHFEDALDAAKDAKGTKNDLDLDADDMRKLVETFKEVVVEHAGRPFPQEPREQMDLATRAVFESWNTERAVLYRRQERIPSDMGTAVNIVAMVFGNLGPDSGTGRGSGASGKSTPSAARTPRAVPPAGSAAGPGCADGGPDFRRPV